MSTATTIKRGEGLLIIKEKTSKLEEEREKKMGGMRKAEESADFVPAGKDRY